MVRGCILLPGRLWETWEDSDHGRSAHAECLAWFIINASNLEPARGAGRVHGAELGSLGQLCALWVPGHSEGCGFRAAAADGDRCWWDDGAGRSCCLWDLPGTGWEHREPHTTHPWVPPRAPQTHTATGHQIPGRRRRLVGLQVNFSSTSWREELQELRENHLLLGLSAAGSQGCVGAGTARFGAAPLAAHTARALPGLPAAGSPLARPRPHQEEAGPWLWPAGCCEADGAREVFMCTNGRFFVVPSLEKVWGKVFLPVAVWLELSGL